MIIRFWGRKFPICAYFDGILVCVRTIAYGRGNIGATTDTTQQSGHTPDKEAATQKPIRLECYLPTTADCLAPT
jgi:hypothetical protein